MGQRRWGRSVVLVTATITILGCSEGNSSTTLSGPEAEACFDGEISVRAADFGLVLDPDAFSDPEFAVRVSGKFSGEDLLNAGAGPLGRPLEIRELVGRRVEYSRAALVSGGIVYVFGSEDDRTDTICAVRELAGSADVRFERATVID